MQKYKTRTLEKSLNSLIGKFPVIMITGPRQVGKTTLLNHLIVDFNKKINIHSVLSNKKIIIIILKVLVNNIWVIILTPWQNINKILILDSSHN